MTTLTKTVRRKTNTVAATYGPDGGRPLVVYLTPGPNGNDMIQIKPSGTRRAETMTVADIYAMMLRCKANTEWRVRMEERKAAKKIRSDKAAARRETRKLSKAVFSAPGTNY